MSKDLIKNIQEKNHLLAEKEFNKLIGEKVVSAISEEKRIVAESMGQKDIGKMSDSELKKEIKKARKQDEKYYEKLVNEFEKRGISEDTKENYDDEQGDVPGEQDTGPDEYSDDDKEKYQNLVKKVMKQLGINDLGSASKEEKKKLFNKIDKLWSSDKERGDDRTDAEM